MLNIAQFKDITQAISVPGQSIPSTPIKTQQLVLPLLNSMMAAHKIGARNERVACLLAQIMVESSNFTALEENLNYKPAVLLSQWGNHFSVKQAYQYGRTREHPANVVMIANIAYGGRMGNGNVASGDGWRYRGGGWLQLTGRDAYAQAQEVTGKPFLEHPELLRNHYTSALVTGTFWDWKRIENLADAGDIVGVSRRWNGGDHGLELRKEIYARTMKILKG